MQKTWRDYLAEQYQVIARHHALAGGLTREQWNWRIRHAWQLVMPGVAVAHTGGLTAAQRAWSAVLRAGSGAALTSDAALLQHGFRAGGAAGLWRPPDLAVAVPATRKVAGAVMADGGRVVCHKVAGLTAWRGTLEPAWRKEVAVGLPILHVHAAVLHAASWAVSDRAAEWRLAAVVQQRLSSVLQIRCTLDQMPRLPRRALIRTVLDDVELGAHAGSELQYLRFCRAHGLPPPDSLQLRVRAGGTHYVDGHYRRQKVSVELDGAHHRSAGQWEADLLRTLQLAVARRGTGELQIRLTPTQLRYDALVIAPLLRQLLCP